MSVGKMEYLSRLQTLLVLLILNGTAKTKLAILAFLCCGEIVKNSKVFKNVFPNHFKYPGADPGFPVGRGADPPGEGDQHTNLPDFPKNCMKLRTFRSVGGARRGAPLGSATGIFCVSNFTGAVTFDNVIVIQGPSQNFYPSKTTAKRKNNL